MCGYGYGYGYRCFYDPCSFLVLSCLSFLVGLISKRSLFRRILFFHIEIGGHGVGESSSDEDEYLIHLVDSPGHVDFSVEVSTAVRLCDGCLILVDVIEGVCVQTHAVLEQAWREGLTPILVLNKIDRLLSELHFSPWDCFKLLNRILEQVNAIQSTFSRADLLRQSEGENQASDHYDEDEILIDSDAFFSPIRGNVVFASAFHGWAFR